MQYFKETVRVIIAYIIVQCIIILITCDTNYIALPVLLISVVTYYKVYYVSYRD